MKRSGIYLCILPVCVSRLFSLSDYASSLSDSFYLKACIIARTYSFIRVKVSVQAADSVRIFVTSRARALMHNVNIKHLCADLA